MRRRFLLLATLLIILMFFSSFTFVKAQTPVIRAVLFFSTDCVHCQEVMNTVLPPIVDQYPGQLDIVGIDVSHPLGETLYRDTVVALNVPDDRLGVPTLVVGNQVLVGADEIPAYFPNIIQAGLAAGGLDWPEIPGLQSVLAAQIQPIKSIGASSSPIQSDPSADGTPGFVTNFLKDPLANTVAVIVLIGMVSCCIWVIINYLRGPDVKFPAAPEWVLPVLVIIGMGVALYLSYIEISKTKAICGPVGNCNSVQESPYAYLFGIIPIGAMGLVGYATILAFWLFKTFGPRKLRNLFTIALWGIAWFGVIFSIYLTFLEPFVIGATCAWCITSAIVMTLILLVTTQPAKEAMSLSSEYTDEDFLESDEDAEAI